MLTLASGNTKKPNVRGGNTTFAPGGSLEGFRSGIWMSEGICSRLPFTFTHLFKMIHNTALFIPLHKVMSIISSGWNCALHVWELTVESLLIRLLLVDQVLCSRAMS